MPTLPILLDIVGFSVILGWGMDAAVLAGVFGFAVIVLGSLIGSGFALSGVATKSASAGTRLHDRR